MRSLNANSKNFGVWSSKAAENARCSHTTYAVVNHVKIVGSVNCGLPSSKILHNFLMNFLMLAALSSKACMMNFSTVTVAQLVALLVGGSCKHKDLSYCTGTSSHALAESEGFWHLV